MHYKPFLVVKFSRKDWLVLTHVEYATVEVTTLRKFEVFVKSLFKYVQLYSDGTVLKSGYLSLN